MAEDNQQDQYVSKQNRIIQHLPIAVKVLQVILAVLAIGLVVDPLNSYQRILVKTRFKLDDAAIIYITIAGYIIINTLFIICHALGDRIPKRTLIIFASVGAILHVVAGSVIVYNWRKILDPYNHNNEVYPSKQYMDMFISAAVFTFLNAIAFVVEVLLLIRYSTKGAH